MRQQHAWIGLGPLVGVATLPVAAFGVVQLAATCARQLGEPAVNTDFLNLYSGAALFVNQPGSTYDSVAQAALQVDLQAGGQAYLAFLLAPHAALLLAPLALLPYGVAYLAWVLIGIGSLILSAYLVAPRVRFAWSWLVWPPLVLLYLPAQQALIMGQTSMLALLGWSVFVSRLNSARHRHTQPEPGALGLLSWSLKPQLLPVFLVALALDRQKKQLVLLLGGIGVLTACALIRLGWSATTSYVQLAAAKLQNSGLGNSTDFNVSIVAGADWLFGLGLLSTLASVLVVGGVWTVLIGVWRRGLASDERWMLQVAVLPLAAVVTAPYALSYELTSWLGSLWLVLRYCGRVQQARRVASVCLPGVWLAANLAVVFPQQGARLATLSGVALTLVVAWLYRTLPDRGYQG